MGGYYPVIFLESRVLMKPETAFTEQDRVEFDEVSCSAFRSLIDRVYNVAVVLVLPSGQMHPSHEKIVAAYRAMDFGARIVGRISAPLDGSSCAFSIGRPVDDWLRDDPLAASSFVILERRDGWVYYDRSIVIAKSERLTEETVDKADEILTHMEFSPYQLARLH